MFYLKHSWLLVGWKYIQTSSLNLLQMMTIRCWNVRRVWVYVSLFLQEWYNYCNAKYGCVSATTPSIQIFFLNFFEICKQVNVAGLIWWIQWLRNSSIFTTDFIDVCHHVLSWWKCELPSSYDVFQGTRWRKFHGPLWANAASSAKTAFSWVNLHIKSSWHIRFICLTCQLLPATSHNGLLKRFCGLFLCHHLFWVRVTLY